MRRLTILLLVLSFVFLLPSPPVLGATDTRYVTTTGTDSGSCISLSSPCLTIGYAISQANPGDTIDVGPGTFAEQLTITKPIVLDGNGGVAATGLPVSSSDATIIQPTAVSNNATSLFSGAWIRAIIVVDTTKGVTIKDVKVDGSSAAFNACAPGYMGIFFRASTGTIQNTHVTDVFHPSAVGCQAVLGVFVQSGNGGPDLNSNVIMSNLYVNTYGKNGITCNEAGTACTVTDSTVIGRGVLYVGDAAQNGIQIGFGAHGRIVGNDVQDNFYDPSTWVACGVLFFQGGGGVGLAKGNSFSGNEQNICTAGVGPRDN